MMEVDGTVSVVRSQTLGVRMQRSAVESALLDGVLDAMPVSDVALEAAVLGIPILDVRQAPGVDVVRSKDGWDV